MDYFYLLWAFLQFPLFDARSAMRAGLPLSSVVREATLLLVEPSGRGEERSSWLRYLGKNSIVIYLDYCVCERVAMHFGIHDIADLGWAALPQERAVWLRAPQT